MADDLDFGATIKGFSPGQKLFNRYKLERILGRGGMGVVWLARDQELERDVALKFLPEIVALDPEAVGDLKRETRRNLDLTHVHIVRIYDFVSDARTAAISMEYVDGATLSALKIEQAERVLSVDRLRPWLQQLTEALHYAHTKAKVVHRDLKPANLMVNRHGDLKITDFGIARGISDSVSRVSKQAGSSGTPVYMSPQQMMGEDPAVADDIYALGATLFELLTGKPPFHSGNIVAQVQGKPAPLVNERRAAAGLPPIPSAWEQAIAACLAKDPAERPSSAAELWRQLDGGPMRTSTPAQPVAASPATDQTTAAAASDSLVVRRAGFLAMGSAGTTLPLALAGVLLAVHKSTDTMRTMEYGVWLAWILPSLLLARRLVTGRIEVSGVAKGLAILWGGAVLLSEALIQLTGAVSLDDPSDLLLGTAFVFLGLLQGATLALANRDESTQRWNDIFRGAAVGTAAGLVAGVSASVAKLLQLIPVMRMHVGLAVLLGTLLCWLILRLGRRTGNQPVRLSWAPPLLLLSGIWLGVLTVLLAMFWHRGAIYAMESTLVLRLGECAAWVLWCALTFGAAAFLAAAKADRTAAIGAGIAFAGGGLLFTEYWNRVEIFLLQLPSDTTFMEQTDIYTFILRLPSPMSSILLGVTLLLAGLLVRLMDRRPSARQWLLHLAGGIMAGLTGYAAAQLPWTPKSWEGLHSYQLWFALAGTGLTTLLLWHWLPRLSPDSGSTAGAK